MLISTIPLTKTYISTNSGSQLGQGQGDDEYDDDDYDNTKEGELELELEPSPQEVEEMSREVFDELKNEKTGKMTVKKFKTWGSIKEVRTFIYIYIYLYILRCLGV